MTPLLLFPCNGNAREAIAASSGYEILGFIDDDPHLQGKRIQGFPVFSREVLSARPDAGVLAVPGNPENFRDRGRLIRGLGLSLDRFISIVHPSAHVSPHSKVGRNVLVMAGVVIGPGVEIQDHVCILPNSVIHHDVAIGELTLIGSNVTVAGFCIVGKNSYIGSGSSLLQNLKIGDEALIGMGSTVIREVHANTRVAGNPARELRVLHE